MTRDELEKILTDKIRPNMSVAYLLTEIDSYVAAEIERVTEIQPWMVLEAK